MTEELDSKVSFPTAGRVLVLGRGDRAFLTVIRSLGRRGLDVHVAMCPIDDVALKSKYVSASHFVPEYESQSSSWLDAVTQLMREHVYDLVIPCDDRSIIPVQRYRDELGAYGRVYSFSPDVYETAFDKISCTELARRLGLRVPREKVILPGTAPEEVLAGLSLPVVVKPPSSFAAEEPSRKRTVKRARSLEEFRRILRDASGWTSVQVQENFIGTGVGVEVLAAEGEVLVAFQHARVHEPMEGGGSSYRRSCDLTPDLLDATKKLMRGLRYTGVAMVEFKLDERTMDWIFIEVNARFWGSLPLAVAAGVDFPVYLYEMLVKGQRAFNGAYRTGIYCRNISRDVRWFMENARADKNDMALARRPWGAVFLELGHLLALRERFDTLVLDDVGPWRAEMALLLGSVREKLWKTLRISPARDSWGRFDSVRRLRRTLERARTVLFVCKGNVCRSPFAEKYAEKRFGDSLSIRSSGYYPKEGRPSPEAGVEAGRRFGVELSTHRSVFVREAMVRAADIVFVFDRANLGVLRAAFPSMRRKMYLLGAVCGGEALEISDPWSGSSAVFDDAYRRIATAVDRLVELRRASWTGP